jgi:hypothetical protein
MLKCIINYHLFQLAILVHKTYEKGHYISEKNATITSGSIKNKVQNSHAKGFNDRHPSKFVWTMLSSHAIGLILFKR